MWEHYGDRHKGACLVFDFLFCAVWDQSFLSCIHKMCGDIGYQRITPVSEKEQRVANSLSTVGFTFIADDLVNDFDSAVIENIRKHGSEMFFRKHGDWSSEREYRFLFVGTAPDYEYMNYSDSLAGIAIGSDASESDRDAIAAVCKKHGIHFFQMSDGWFRR